MIKVKWQKVKVDKSQTGKSQVKIRNKSKLKWQKGGVAQPLQQRGELCPPERL